MKLVKLVSWEATCIKSSVLYLLGSTKSASHLTQKNLTSSQIQLQFFVCGSKPQTQVSGISQMASAHDP